MSYFYYLLVNWQETYFSPHCPLCSSKCSAKARKKIKMYYWLLICPKNEFALEKQDYWLLTIKNNKYKILPHNKIDTINVSENGLKQNLCIAYKMVNADANSNSKLSSNNNYH